MPTEELQERFQDLLDDHKKILYKVCNSYCPNSSDRDDLAQEIIFQLWRSFKDYDGRTLFSTWMYRVALNVAISSYRRERVRSKHVFADPIVDVPDERENQSDDVRFLFQCIERLDPLNKALMLLYLDGHSYAEISEVLGISETNVGTKVGRLKKAFREQLGGTVRT